MQRELKIFKSDPPRNIYAEPVGDDLFKWEATNIGTEGIC